MTPHQVEQAAGWQARLLSDHCSEHDRILFADWLGECEAHHQAYGLVSQIWKSGSFAERKSSRKLTRRAVLSGGALIGAFTLFSPSGADAREFRTGRQERRRLALETMDIEMDACSALICGPSPQEMTIGNGRFALVFRLDHSGFRSCGWSVLGGRGRYALDITDRTMQIAVLEGGLSLSGHGQTRLTLSEGQALHFDRLARRGTVAAARPDDILAWREGRALFHNTPLDQAVAEMARYSDKPVLILSPALARLRISGVFHTQDPTRFFKALAHLLPLRVTFGPKRIEIVKL
ncbi:DUF4880 domain-containing protein [Asaia sp. BMEF1]|uniref:FecR family protein n=1 Tax=Asaia sp. BMEF1 TaxID=3155932 RepID=UPI003F672DC0